MTDEIVLWLYRKTRVAFRSNEGGITVVVKMIRPSLVVDDEIPVNPTLGVGSNIVNGIMSEPEMYTMF